MDHAGVVTILNELIELNQDSAKGFVRAQNDVTTEALVDLFDGLAARRVEMVEALQDKVNQLGGSAQEGASTKGALERGWLNIKAAMTIEHDKTDALVVADRAKHEADVIATYEELRAKGLPPEIRDLVQEQYEEIKAVQEQLARREEEIEAMRE